MKKKVRRPRKRQPSKHKPNLTYMREYEEGIILADLTAMGGQGTARSLSFHAPGRYDTRRLAAVLKQMVATSTNRRTGVTSYATLKRAGHARGFHGRGILYAVPERTEQIAA